MKRLAVCLVTLPLLGAAVLTSLPAFANNMDTAGAANDQIHTQEFSDFPSSPEEYLQCEARRRRKR